ncbi:MAG TPA: DUF485 domain-containing protein [Gammaproteobacteria bacterium]|nr:DUF485 domain-containing protein [Gammaproteobacteria bacterium]
MSEEIYARIHRSEAFHRYIAKRQRFTWTLSILMLLVYFLFILFIAFAPEILGRPLMEGSVITIGIPIGIAIIVFAFLLTGWYVHKSNSEFDRDRRKIIEDILK